jgi:RimJ/RimL family protein N-acetyltransferase
VSTRPIQEIEPKDYERLRPIMAGLSAIQLNVAAILDGTCPGRVYADDVAHPRTAYLISGDGHYLAGATDNQAFNEALNAALPRDHYFVLFCDPERWSGALDVVLRDTYAVRATRHYYTLAEHKMPDWQDRIPEGFSMQRVDAGFLATERKNRDGVLEWILEEWNSVDDFVERGFGFCLVHEDEDGVVSWSLSDYVQGDRCEMGIETDWNYRRQGFGTLAAAATAAHALEQGFSTIGWHCWHNNAGSIGVAGNVGFEKATDYDIYINHWVAENITDMSQEEFQAFAERYEREFQARPPESGFPYVVAAKAWALGGDRAGCFRHLHRAVDIGWLRGTEHLREIWPEFFWNPDLDGMEEWQALVKRFETNE